MARKEVLQAVHEDQQPKVTTKPLLKYAGSKQRLLPQILPKLGRCARYVEPFCGSAAVFFALPPGDRAHAWINDANPDLIGLYHAVQRWPKEVHVELERLSRLHGEVLYYEVRDSFNAAEHPVGSAARAAQFLYLNRGGFNGVWRVNRNGKFNVPWNKKAGPLHLPSVEDFARAWAALQGARITSGSFEPVLMLCGEPGTVVYCDPPYPGTFDGYTTGGFGESSHQRLAELAFQAAGRGARVVLSISDHQLSRQLYSERRGPITPEIEVVTLRHAVGATADRRRDVSELLITLAKE